jgi:hypothetical protein
MLACLMPGAAVHLSAALPTTTSLQLANDTNEDIEPTVLSYTNLGTDSSLSAWMRTSPTVASNTSILNYKAWTGNGSVSSGTIPTHPDYALYYDPILKYSGLTAVHLVALGRRTTTDTAADPFEHRYVGDYHDVRFTNDN